MRFASLNFTILISILIAVLVFTVEVILVSGTFGVFGDEKYYIAAGVSYVRDPRSVVEYNWEHPPLSKYIFGFLVLSYERALRLFLYVIGIACALVFYIAFKRVYPSNHLSLLLLLLILLDLLYAQTVKHALLDVPMLFFSSLFLYAVFRYFKSTNSYWINIAGFLGGLALACKWSFVYFLLPALILTFKYKRLKATLTILLLVILSYFLTYFPTLVSGVSVFTVLSLQYEMLSYQLYLHSPLQTVSLNSLLKFFFKVEFWEVYSGGTIYVYPNGTAVLAEDFVREGWKLYFYYGFGGLAWWLFLPALIASTARLVKSVFGGVKLSFGEEYFTLTAIFQTPFLTHGDISWYYFDVLPTFYVLLVLNLKNFDKKYSILLVVLSLIYNFAILYTRKYYVVFPL